MTERGTALQVTGLARGEEKARALTTVIHTAFNQDPGGAEAEQCPRAGAARNRRSRVRYGTVMV
jgi:hypothetical protein